LYAQSNYLNYHKNIIETEQLIAERKFEEDLINFQSIFNSSYFVFQRDFKIAAQLALILGDRSLAVEYLKLGIKNGWTLKQMRQNKLTRSLIDSVPESEVDSSVKHYHQRIN
jgi:hypothetical protein